MFNPLRIPTRSDGRLRRARRRARLLAIGATLVSAACGGEQPAARPSFERITLTPTGPGTFDRTSHSVLKLATHDELSRLLVKDCRAEWIDASPSGTTEAGLRLTGKPGGTLRVRLPGRFDLRTFNAVVVHATTKGCLAGVRLRRASGPPVTFEKQVVFVDSLTPAITIDVRPVAPPGNVEPCETLELNFENVTEDVTLHGIELKSIPVTSFLPDPAEAPRLAHIGNQSRCGVSVFGGRPLEATLDVELGDALAFSVGQPQSVFEIGGASTLDVTLLDGTSVSPLTRMQLDASHVDSWRRLSSSLDAFAGRKVRVKFALESSQPENGCVIAELALERHRPSPPTVVLITSDTHRADHVNAAGLGVTIQTPHLDALAARGVFFEDCLATTNSTLPSHVAMLTGLSPRDTRLVDNFIKLSADALTLAERFQAAGYRTWAATSAMQLSPEHGGLGQGFDRFACSLEGIRTAPDTLKFVREWQADADGQPLFLWVHVFDAHTPYIPPQEFARPYYQGHESLDPKSTSGRPGEQSLGDVELMRAEYRGEISFLDDQLASLFDDPRLGQGIVAFTGDHGESLGAHGIFWDHKGLYTETVRVPLIIAWPQAQRGKRVASPVTNRCIARTLLELADVPANGFDGPSLLPLMQGESVEPAPRFVLSAQGLEAAVTSDAWQLILELRTHDEPNGLATQTKVKHRLELFNVRVDPQCEHELSASEPARARAMRLQLVEWLAAARGPGLVSSAVMDSAGAKGLAALGYTATPSAVLKEPWIDPNCTCAECAKWR